MVIKSNGETIVREDEHCRCYEPRRGLGMSLKHGICRQSKIAMEHSLNPEHHLKKRELGNSDKSAASSRAVLLPARMRVDRQ